MHFTRLKNGAVIALFLFVILPAPGALAANGTFIGIRLPLELYYNPLEPKTPEEVRQSYQWVAQRRGGINAIQAKIIAQYRIIAGHLESSYEIGKPKIIKETPVYWVVRLPARFSISGGDNSPLVVCVDKKTGAVGCPASIRANVKASKVE